MNYSRGELVRFGIVGATGFGVNAFVLALLHQTFGISLVVAQLVAAETAIAVNFTLHHNWTYSKYGKQRLATRFLRFNTSMATGSLITLAVLVALVHWIHLYYLVALGVAAIAGMVWNLVMNKLVIWRWFGDPEHAKAASRALSE